MKTSKIQASVLAFLFCFLTINLEAQTALDNYITGQMKTNNIPGLAACIIKDGKLAWTKGYGWANLDEKKPVTPNTIFMLASVSKPFTSAALMKLYEAGKFGLDDSINTFLPYKVHHPKFKSTPITFRHLLTHTSGIRDNWDVMIPNYVNGDSPIPLGEFLQDYLTPAGKHYDEAKHFSASAPGTKAEYSNIGTALIGYLVETISGQPFDQYSKEKIFTELCMSHTAWKLAALDTTNIARPYGYENGAFYDYGLYGYPDYPDGQLRSSVIDVARFMFAHINNGLYDNKQFLQEATVNEIFTPQIPAIDSKQGLIWSKLISGGRTFWFHNGGDFGVGTMMLFDPQKKTGVVILTNSEGKYNLILNRLIQVSDTIGTTKAPAIGCQLQHTALAENTATLRTTVYPNPASHNLFLQLHHNTQSPINIRLFSSNGSEIKNIRFHASHAGTYNTDVSGLPAGLYILQISAQGAISNNKVIIE